VKKNRATHACRKDTNNLAGYTFTATISDGSGDMFGITIGKTDGSTNFTAHPRSWVKVIW
jgi:hypothetical protein